MGACLLAAVLVKAWHDLLYTSVYIYVGCNTVVMHYRETARKRHVWGKVTSGVGIVIAPLTSSKYSHCSILLEKRSSISENPENPVLLPSPTLLLAVCLWSGEYLLLLYSVCPLFTKVVFLLQSKTILPPGKTNCGIWTETHCHQLESSGNS